MHVDWQVGQACDANPARSEIGQEVAFADDWYVREKLKVRGPRGEEKLRVEDIGAWMVERCRATISSGLASKNVEPCLTEGERESERAREGEFYLLDGWPFRSIEFKFPRWNSSGWHAVVASSIPLCEQLDRRTCSIRANRQRLVSCFAVCSPRCVLLIFSLRQTLIRSIRHTAGDRSQRTTPRTTKFFVSACFSEII